MVVELTGAPGSGKSTVFNELRAQAGTDERIVFSIDRALLAGWKLQGLAENFLGALALDLRLGELAWRNKSQRALIAECFAQVNGSDNALPHRLNLKRNILKKIAVNSFIRRTLPPETVYIIDEGLTHLPYNTLTGTGENDVDPTAFETLVALIELPDVLVIVGADEKTATQRVRLRGHRRIDVTDPVKLRRLIRQSMNVSRMLARRLDRSTVVMEVSNNKGSDPRVIAAKVMRLIDAQRPPGGRSTNAG